MQTTNNPNPVVKMRAKRVFWFGGKFVQPGTELELDYVNARGLESSGKVDLLTRPESLEQVIVAPASKPEPTKGKAK